MVVIICGKYGNNWFRTENVTERTWFLKSRSNDLEDIGQGQRSSHATHLLMLVIICTKYGKNPSRTVDATERTQISRSRPNDLENVGQGQSALHVTHPLMLIMICAKYGKNASRIVDFFFKVKAEKIRKISEKIEILEFCYKLYTRKYGNNQSRTENATEWTRFSKSSLNDLEGIGQGQRASHVTHLLILVIICTKYGKNPRTVDATEWTRFSRPRPKDLEDIGQGQRSL